MIMRTDRVLIISLLLLAPAGITGQTLERGAISPPASDQSNHRAGLVVTSNVPGALIYLDSLSVGVTPLDRTDLRPGVYHLRVIHPERRSWYSDSIDDTVELKPDGRLEFRAFFDYVYRIQSIPFGAKILLGNLYQGETPAVLKTPNRLVGTLLLRKEGYDDASYDLGRWNGELIELVLKPRQGIENIEHALNLEPATFRHKTPILVSGIVGIASGVAAVYFKQKADKSFGDYQQTGDQTLLSRTERYDTISGVSLVAFELSLTSLAYLLLNQ